MAIGNKWQYTNGSNATEVKLIGTTTFEVNPYYEITDSNTQINAQVWMTKRGASYYQKVSATTQTQGSTSITIEGFEIKLLKDNLAVGETWNGSANPKVTYSGGSTNLAITYTGNIIAKDVSVTLNGITYNNVIKMGLNIKEIINSQTTTISGENWFAKDIGLIYDSTKTSSDNITKTRYLTSYELH